MKKYLFLPLAIILCFACAACGGNVSDLDGPAETETAGITQAAAAGRETMAQAGEDSDFDTAPESENEPETRNEPEAENEPESENVPEAASETQSTAGKIAVVYFSSTGTTAQIARLIAEETGADLFEILPKIPYSAEDLNYNEDSCRANQEMNDDTARPSIENDLSALSEYETVYLGHPIWWGRAPRIIQTFLETCDLSNTAVYTFCTSGSSGIEQSVRELQELYSDINIVSGKRFSNPSEEDIRTWIDSLE